MVFPSHFQISILLVSVGPLRSPDGNYGNDMVDGEVHMVKDQVTRELTKSPRRSKTWPGIGVGGCVDLGVSRGCREVMDMVGEVMDMVGPMVGVILDRKDSFSLLHSYYSRGHFKTFTYYIKLEQITQQDILYSLGQTRPSWREADDAVTMFFLITTFHTQFPLFQK